MIPLSLTYDSEAIQDGLGAQILRKVAIRAVSKFFRLGYVDSKIEKIHVHQLDSAQTREEIEAYLERVNGIFRFEDAGITKFDEVHRIHDLSRRALLKYWFKSLLVRRKILLRVTIPFYFTNNNPRIFHKITRLMPNFESRESNRNPKIVIHFRAGVNQNFIDPGKSETRFIAFDFFENQVLQVLESNPDSNFDICLLTDAPPERFEYIPLPEQIILWERSGFVIEKNSIMVEPLDLSSSKLKHYERFSVVYGGDPLEALKEMASADYLFMSRSTLSFLGGLLNKSGKVIYPPRFGMTPMKNWLSKAE